MVLIASSALLCLKKPESMVWPKAPITTNVFFAQQAGKQGAGNISLQGFITNLGVVHAY